ncbi:hypothetical protein B4U80_14176 [Leptotrombidium deliense]|uniref:TIL domain-containing protein n=1 Tax=Leptotrombidium deliense TaxID=299467 RepID=A0A443S115_9ACAR|nr:hypothetical protein B4U80_14176 [Leptotrombidium deliense]
MVKLVFVLFVMFFCSIVTFCQQHPYSAVRGVPGPQYCRSDETYACVSACERTCYDITHNTPVGICPPLCEEGCVCIEPKYRAADGNCYNAQDCPAE